MSGGGLLRLLGREVVFLAVPDACLGLLGPLGRNLVTQAPVGEGNVHAECRADLDQQRHEDRERGLHRGDVEPGQLGEYARLRISFRHHRAARGAGKLAIQFGNAGFELLGLLGGAQLGAETVELLAEIAGRFARDIGAARRRLPQTLVLDAGDVGLHGLHGPMLRDPGKLLLSPFGFGARVLVGVGLDRALTGRIEPVERCVAERGGHRVAGDHSPHYSGSSSLRPHPIPDRSKQEERHQCLEAIGSRRGQTVDLPIHRGFAETEPEPVVHRGGHSQQYAGRDHPEHSQEMSCH